MVATAALCWGNLLDNVDGIVIDKKTKTLYWTNMGPAIGPKEGEFFQADGSIKCIGLNGANRRTLVGHGLTVTSKQVAADLDEGFLYWGDREGMRVMRSNLDGSNVTVLVRNGVRSRSASRQQGSSLIRQRVMGSRHRPRPPAGL
jgi:hypothetical protein